MEDWGSLVVGEAIAVGKVVLAGNVVCDDKVGGRLCIAFTGSFMHIVMDLLFS